MQKVNSSLAGLIVCLGGAFSQGPPGGVAGTPPLPRISPEKFPTALRKKVQKAYADAHAYPLDPSANGQLGMILEAYRPSDRTAERCYRRARALDPSSFRWAYYLGLVLAEQKRYAEAAATFREALKLRPRYLPAELKLGQCLLASGVVEEARSTLERALANHSHSAQVYFEMGRVEEARGDVNAGAKWFRKACDLFPHFGAAHYSLARADQRLGKADEARAEEALAEQHKYESPDPEDPLMAELRNLYTDPNYFVELGVQYALRGKLEEAVALHEKALREDSSLVQAHVNLISLYGRLRIFDRAEEHYRAAVEIDPQNAKAYYDRGVVLTEQGRNTDAEAAFRKVLELDPGHANAHNNLGDLLQKEGELDAAADEFRKAVASNPHFPQAHFNLGRILVNQGNLKEGIAELLKSLETSDEDAKPSYLYAVGAAYARSGDKNNSLPYLRMAHEQAAARHQSKLLESIEHDLEILEKGGTSRR